MGWAQKLAETYDNCLSEVGVFYQDKTPLLPIYHTTQQAYIEILIDSDGNFLYGRSRVITDKGDATTIIPCTEDSALGTNDRAPHPLFDKLNYLAGDYKKYTNQDGKFDKYIKNLRLWCESPYKHPKIVSIMRYLEKGTLIKDLIDDGILFTNENNLLIDKWTDPDPPPIFKVVNSQDKAFVRIVLYLPTVLTTLTYIPGLTKAFGTVLSAIRTALKAIVIIVMPPEISFPYQD